jgi:hypothetical protein
MPQQVMSASPPKSVRKSGLSQRAMSALPQKADMCSANENVR